MKAYEALTTRGQVRRIRPMAQDLLRQHGMDADRLSLIHHGENTTFRAWCGGAQYLCRIHRPGYQTETSIQSELHFIAYLRNLGLRVPDPVGEGKTALLSVSAPRIESRHAVLFRWLPGRFYRKMSPTLAVKLGRFVAELHLHTEGYAAPEDFERPVSDAIGLFSALGGRLDQLEDQDRALFLRLRDRVITFEEQIGRSRGLFNLIHADLHVGNRLIHNGEFYAIDFDDLTWGWFVYDVMLCLDSHRDAQNYDELLSAFVVGYREVRRMSDEELDAIPLFTAVRRAQIALWVLSRSDHPAFVRRLPEVMERTRRDITRFLASSR